MQFGEVPDQGLAESLVQLGLTEENTLYFDANALQETVDEVFAGSACDTKQVN